MAERKEFPVYGRTVTGQELYDTEGANSRHFTNETVVLSFGTSEIADIPAGTWRSVLREPNVDNRDEMVAEDPANTVYRLDPQRDGAYFFDVRLTLSSSELTDSFDIRLYNITQDKIQRKPVTKYKAEGQQAPTLSFTGGYFLQENSVYELQVKNDDNIFTNDEAYVFIKSMENTR